MNSFFVSSILTIEQDGLYTTVDLEQTNTAVNELLDDLTSKGYHIHTVLPVQSGAGQFKIGTATTKTKHLWSKPVTEPYSYGFGYSYTSGFMIMAYLKPL